MAENSFNLETFATDFAKKEELRVQRQAAEKEKLATDQRTNEVLMNLEQESVKQKRQFVKQLEPVVSEFQTLEAARQRQKELSSSGNFVDALQAMQDAMLNPNLATSEGRARTRAELNANVAAMSIMQDAQQRATQQQMESALQTNKVQSAKYDTAALLERQQTEVLKASQERSAAIVSGLQDTQAAQTMILAQSTPEQLTQYKNMALKTGKVNISGFEVPQSILDLELNRRTNLAYDTKAKENALRNEDMKQVQMANDRILPNLTLSDKEALQNGEPVVVKTDKDTELTFTPDMFTPGVLSKAITDARTTVDRHIEEQAKAIQFPDVSGQLIRPGLESTESMLTKLPKNSPAFSAVQLHKQQLLAAMDTLTSASESLYGKDGKKVPDPNAERMFRGLQAGIGAALDKERTQVDAAIDKQSTLDARGNKDLKDLYTSWYRGDVLNPDAINKLASESIVTNSQAPIGILGPEVGKAAFNKYVELINAEKSANGGNLPGIDSKVQTDRKKELAQIATQAAVNQFAQQDTDKFIGAQITLDTNDDPALKSNPVANFRDSTGNKVFKDQNAWLGFLKNAELEGSSLWRREPDNQWLTDEDILRLESGTDVSHDGKAISVAEYARSSNFFQAQQVLADLDAKKPGLAREYANWWQDSGPVYAKTYVDSVMDKAKAGKFQDSVFATMSASQIEGGINEYSRAISQAADSFNGDLQKRRKDWVTYNSDPGNMQAMALQLDDSLSDEERQLVYVKGILPIINKSKQAGLDMNQTNMQIEASLADPTKTIEGYADDPALRKAMTKVLANRTRIQQAMLTISDVPWLGHTSPFGANITVPQDIQNQLGGDVGPFGYKGGLIKDIKNYFSPETTSFNRLLNTQVKRKPYDWYREILSAKPPKQ